MQVCRSLRWNHLLAPLGFHVPTGPLLAISAVGFMAILALPARLGELVRPGLLRKRGVSATAALGTVAVERIVDGLLVSLFVFGAFFALRGPSSPGWMMATAWIALTVFTAALVFLIFALRWPTGTVAFCLKISLLPRLAPRIARVIEDKLLEMIRGFDVLRDRANLLAFLAWSIVYWGANGFGVWVLAHGFALDLSVVGAFAVMGLVAVGITLPNSPGLVGQFQWFTLLGLTLYLGTDANTPHTALYATTFAFANTHYALQVGWYIACGALGLATPWVSLADLRRARAASKTGDSATA
ncbi:lysylphosphatidylglycerol synthase transmembrane domain-containing protein [soil metagenome]